jgi:hypothetical protein
VSLSAVDMRLAERARDHLLRRVERQRAAPHYHERRRRLEAMLIERRVGAPIRERILRLNTDLREGYQLRGWHYKRFREPRLNADVIPKGYVLRRWGREVWERIQRSHIIKSGRREYASSLAVMQARL